jgi:hypothetical protein
MLLLQRCELVAMLPECLKPAFTDRPCEGDITAANPASTDPYYVGVVNQHLADQVVGFWPPLVTPRLNAAEAVANAVRAHIAQYQHNLGRLLNNVQVAGHVTIDPMRQTAMGLALELPGVVAGLGMAAYVANDVRVVVVEALGAGVVSAAMMNL